MQETPLYNQVKRDLKIDPTKQHGHGVRVSSLLVKYGVLDLRAMQQRKAAS